MRGVLGLDENTDEDRVIRQDEIENLISRWTSTRTPREAMLELQCAGVPAGAVLTNVDLLDDPHLAARDFFVSVSHPDTGTFRYVGFPFKLSQTPARLRMAAPSLGEHNREILSEVGLSENEIADLAEAGIIGDRPRGFA
jgi:crotonobetainyl-CoA:carnitine CoA-transferase CaiB-like acyl-CoA transferase